MFDQSLVKKLNSVISRSVAIMALSLYSAATPASENCKILVMGDSLSAAYGLSVEQGWVALMEANLEEKFPECSLVNASVSGETTAGGKSRLPKLLQMHQPTLMILELGANDGLRGLPISLMKKNLNFMIDEAKKYDTKTVLIGMQIPPNYGPAYTRQFAQTFSEVANEKGTELVPFMLEGFALNPNAFQADGIHPNAESQQIILNNVWPYVQKALD